MGQRARRRDGGDRHDPARRGHARLRGAWSHAARSGRGRLLDEQGYTALVAVVILTTLVDTAGAQVEARAGSRPARHHETGSVRRTVVPRSNADAIALDVDVTAVGHHDVPNHPQTEPDRRAIRVHR